jgi:hypothetical protein
MKGQLFNTLFMIIITIMIIPKLNAQKSNDVWKSFL